MMQKIALVFACWACVGHGQTETERVQSDVFGESQKPLRSLATLLMADNPSAAFNPSASGARIAARSAALASSRPGTIGMEALPPSATKDMVEALEGVGPETAMKVFDPLGLGTMGSEKTLRWFRHAEIKHGRVAMAAMVGLLFHINHIHFPGYLSPTFGVTFEQLSKMGPFEAWNAIPLLGQIQILWTIAGLEHASECLNPDGHYTKGGTPGDLKFLKRFWDTPGFTKKLSAEELAEKRVSELKNGRLAMLGIASICAAMSVPGSVPLLAKAPALTGPAFALPFGTF